MQRITPPAARHHPQQAKPNPLRGALAGLPVVILQSCDSLDERVLWCVDESGGVALVGSVTPIHSGSGSSLVQALSGAILYRGATLGEAFRDAQNYLLCLGEWKVRRGLKEQAKSRRVALSFRVWGDPELRVLPAWEPRPVEPPVAARCSAPGRLIIDVPQRRLPEARNAKYVAAMFPGSQAAGMVAASAGGSVRRVMPVYFFRLPLPDGFPADQSVLSAQRASKPGELSRRCPGPLPLCALLSPAGEGG